MVRAILRVDHDNKGVFRRDGDEIGMRHGVALAAGGSDFVRGEGNGAIEFADGGYDHKIFYRTQCGLSIRLRCRLLDWRDDRCVVPRISGRTAPVPPGQDGSAQLGGRFSLKAAMPSLASADSRAERWWRRAASMSSRTVVDHSSSISRFELVRAPGAP
jgi:hypothetical protein